MMLRIWLWFQVKVGDKEVDVMKGFYLYVTTKLPNPSYTPEVSNCYNVVKLVISLLLVLKYRWNKTLFFS